MLAKIKAIAIDIFNDLGSGFPENIYQNAFEVSLRVAGIRYESQRVDPIPFKGFNIGYCKLDLVVYDDTDAMVVELKATESTLSPKEVTQLRKYLECTNIKYGLLINFPQTGRNGCVEEVEFVSIGIKEEK